MREILEQKLGPYLFVENNERESVIKCSKCNTAICDKNENPKLHLMLLQDPFKVAGPLFPDETPFVLRRFLCPICKRILFTEIAHKDDSIIYDIRLKT